MLVSVTATDALRIAVEGAFAPGHLLGWLAARAVPGAEDVDGRHYRRAVRVGDAVGLLDLQVGDDHLLVRTHGLSPEMLRGPVRRLAGLDGDHAAARAALAADPLLAPAIAATPGLRTIGCVDGYELACRAVLGQQVSVAGARTTTARLVAALGTPLSDDRRWRAFPPPDVLAESPLDGLGLTEARRRTLRALAAAVRDGLDLGPRADTELTIAALLDLPGVGPWTAAYVAMRALGDVDAFPTGDVGLVRGSRALGGPTRGRELAAHAERWRPYRAYAAEYLWSVA